MPGLKKTWHITFTTGTYAESIMRHIQLIAGVGTTFAVLHTKTIS